MKNTIHGFQQKAIVELGLTNDECLVLRWFVDFAETEKMRTEIFENKTFYWVNYQSVLINLPILRFQKRQLQNVFKKMVNTNVLCHLHIKKDGSFSFYAFGSSFKLLIPPPTKKITDPYVKNYAPIETVKEPIKSLKKEKSLEVMNQFNEFYKAYPKKVAKQTALKAYEKALKLTTHDKIMEGVEKYKKQIQLNKTEPQFIAMPATWLNGGRWDDDYTEKQNLTINQKWASIYEAEKKKESNNVPRTQSNFIPPPIPPTLSTW